MVDLVKQTEQNRKRLANLGKYGIKGGPGREKGSKNKFSLIKEQLAELFEEEQLKEKLRTIIKTNQGGLSRTGLKELMGYIIAILPKEVKGEGFESRTIFLQFTDKASLLSPTEAERVSHSRSEISAVSGSLEER